MTSLRSIQYLRGLAALAVVSYHAGQWVLSSVDLGAAGVDVFFIISGFVMWTSTWGRSVSPGRFLWRRLARVAPLYWLVTLLVALGVLLSPGIFPNVTPQLGHLAKSLLFIPHVNPQGDPFPLLAPGWTLNYEAVFYLAFAVSLLAPAAHRIAVLAALLAPLACLGLIYFPLYRLFANPMLLQFLAGVLIARLWLQRALPSARTGWLLTAAAIALFGGTHLIGVAPDFFARPFLWGVPAAILVLGAVSLETADALPRSAVLGRLGDASYSIYLVHVPVLALFNRAVGPIDAALFFTLGMVLSVGVGLLCHAWVERPLLAYLRGRRDAPAALTGTPRPI